MSHQLGYRTAVAAFLLWLSVMALAPLPQLTETESVRFFVQFACVVVLAKWLFSRWPVVPELVTLAVMGLMLYHYFFRQEVPLDNPEWLLLILIDMVQNADELLARQVEGMSGLSRTAYFLLSMWWLLGLFWRYLYRNGWVLFCLILGVVYFALLDSFTPYDGKRSIVWTIILGLLLMALQRVDDLRRRFHLSQHHASRWMAGSLAVVLLFSGVAYASPKPGPHWPDPLPWIVGGRGEGPGAGEGSAVQKVGYGADDSHLGGPFVQDETPVLEVWTTRRSYWRGEVKDYYTGQGWITGALAAEAHFVPVGQPLPATTPALYDLNAFRDNMQVEQRIRYADDARAVRSRVGWPLFHQGMLEQIQAVNPPVSGTPVMVGQGGGVLYPQAEPREWLVTSYLPVVDLDALRQEESDIPPEISQVYLQLPPDLPQRVQDLALELTAEAFNTYDKAKAVERYLRSSSFVYETTDLPQPPEDQDFVDFFLFESQMGYCDYFSTAMAVMLRAVGIPTRWVKGFAPGDLTVNTVNGISYLEGTVRNKHAHSWVEVYIAGYGWLPFEPTPGFTMPMEVAVNVDDSNIPESSVPEMEIPLPLDMPEWEAGSGTSAAEGEKSGIRWVWLLLAGGVLAALWWMYRHSLWFFVQLNNRTYKQPGKLYQQAFERLLKVLRKRRKRAETETLREYVQRFPNSYPGKEALIKHSLIYERLRYGADDGWIKAEAGGERREGLREWLEELWRWVRYR